MSTEAANPNDPNHVLMEKPDSPLSSILSHDDYRIALYYVYIPIPQVDAHVTFQTDLCRSLQLGGRIRVSPEGLNGVLSGLHSNVQEYEQRTRQELSLLLEPMEHEQNQQQDDDHPLVAGLDVKYCHLRSDLTVSAQLFQNLSVKATREVVSLNEPTPTTNDIKMCLTEDANHNNNLLTDKAYWRRRRRRRGPHDSSTTNTNIPSTPSLLTAYQPAPHVTPSEWNQLLWEKRETAILIDARNVYESKLGHFLLPGIPTLLPATRQYSSLPQVLSSTSLSPTETQSFQSHLAGKHIFWYCTGGVRCERATAYMQQIIMTQDCWDHHHNDNAMTKPLGMYQLQGGIQRYLQQYSGDPVNCHYVGKNFVFDPRRYDPKVGYPAQTALGICVLCQTSHDDYDNGHAPCENKEARCCRCRILVLVCNDCRSAVRCWGEEVTTDKQQQLPDLYCGGITECIDEGNNAVDQFVILKM